MPSDHYYSMGGGVRGREGELMPAHDLSNYSREAARITLDKVSSWEEFNAATLQEADEKFKTKTRELWKEFAVSGVLQYDKKKNKQVLKPFTDLDGNCALGILKEAGINTSKLEYLQPGATKQGAINLDTGDRFGVEYDEDTYTAYFDHHKKGVKDVTSTTEIMYKTMVDLGMLEKSDTYDRMVDFATKIDNRKFQSEEFLKSAKTLRGLQRGLKFEQVLMYFKDHQSPTEELTPAGFEKYGLKDAAKKQQKTVDEAMATLEKMEHEGKVTDTQYGKVVINVNNELAAGSSAAYVKYVGIINMTPGKSFAVTLRERELDEQSLRQKLGDRFQGKIVRGKMWLFNEEMEKEQGSLELSLNEVIEVLR